VSDRLLRLVYRPTREQPFLPTWLRRLRRLRPHPLRPPCLALHPSRRSLHSMRRLLILRDPAFRRPAGRPLRRKRERKARL